MIGEGVRATTPEPHVVDLEIEVMSHGPVGIYRGGVVEDSLVHGEVLRPVPGGPRVGLGVGEHDHAVTWVGVTVQVCDPLAVSHVALRRVVHWVGRRHEPQVNVRRILLVTAPNSYETSVGIKEEPQVVLGLELREKRYSGLVLLLVCDRQVAYERVV